MNLSTILRANRSEIITKWVNTLHGKFGERYRVHTRRQTVAVCGEGADGSYDILVRNSFSRMDQWTQKIAGLALETHMSLSDVQNDCELYRAIVMPILVKNVKPENLPVALAKLNRCLAYMITRFSDYFEMLHEKQIRDYAENLEQKVLARSRELAESEAKYRTLVEEINDGYFVNLDDRIVFANRAFCEMHGYEREEVLGRHYWDLVALESLDMTKAFYEKRLQGENMPKQYTFFRRHKNGSSLPTENKVEVMLYEGKFAAAGICRDITERVRMEKKIRDSENLARIGQLTSSLAHEIRNPLSSIKMSIQLAMDGLPDYLDEKEALKISASQIYRLERILSEMLDFAKPLAMDMELASVNDIVVSSLLIVEQRCREKSIVVRRNFSRNLPDAYVDEGKIEQALINVFLNAIEAVPVGGNITVSTRADPMDQRYARIVVVDNGPGVDADDLPCLFDPFFTKKKKGTGLGLFNVKKIVHAHGGTVAVTNGARKGLRLSIVLPVEYSVLPVEYRDDLQ